MPRLQNFKVHKLLGKGSYGKVYKVQRASDDKFYALKETDLRGLNQAERMDAVNEVRLLVSMNHPSVIRYHEAFLNANKLCVVMEYAPYGDLRYYISKGQRLQAPFPEEAIWRIFLQLCRGLQALHNSNIIHRDIKPANIFLCQNDVLKIGDLGVAKALTRIDFAKTQIGTPVYMAPEVWTGKLYSYNSDLWSLGCVLYEMMTFKLPIEGRTIQELKVKVASGRYRPITPGQYSADLVNFCHSLLTVDPKRRPSLDSILASSAAAKWMRVVPNLGPNVAPNHRWSENGGPSAVDVQRGAGKNLMNTIVVPKDIRQLHKVLPPPSYEESRTRAVPVMAPQSQVQPPSRPLSRGEAAVREAAAVAARPVPPAQPRLAAAPVRPLAAPRYASPYGMPAAYTPPAAMPHPHSGPNMQRLKAVDAMLGPGARPPPRRISYS